MVDENMVKVRINSKYYMTESDAECLIKELKNSMDKAGILHLFYLYTGKKSMVWVESE